MCLDDHVRMDLIRRKRHLHVVGRADRESIRFFRNPAGLFM